MVPVDARGPRAAGGVAVAVAVARGGRARGVWGREDRGPEDARGAGVVLVVVVVVVVGGARGCGEGGDVAEDELAAAVVDDAGVASAGVGGGVCDGGEVGLELEPGVHEDAFAGLCLVAGELGTDGAVLKVHEDAGGRLWEGGGGCAVFSGLEGLEGGGQAFSFFSAFAEG